MEPHTSRGKFARAPTNNVGLHTNCLEFAAAFSGVFVKIGVAHRTAPFPTIYSRLQLVLFQRSGPAAISVSGLAIFVPVPPTSDAVLPPVLCTRGDKRGEIKGLGGENTHMQYSSTGPSSFSAQLHLFIRRTSSILSDAMASSSDRHLTPPAGPPLLEGDGTVNPAGITYTLNAERNRRGEANVTVRGLPNTEW